MFKNEINDKEPSENKVLFLLSFQEQKHNLERVSN
jgi:hypothetical protein